MKTIVIIGSVISGLIVFGTIRWLLNKSAHKIRNIVLTILSTSLALFGLVITIGDEFFSQYDYNPSTILKYQRYSTEGVPMSELLSNTSQNPSQYVLVVDTTKSTNKQVDFYATAKKQLRTINEELKSYYCIDTIKIQPHNNKINFQELLKLRAINALMKIDKLEFDTITELYVLFFADKTRKTDPIKLDHRDGYACSGEIGKQILDISTKDFNGERTDFEEVLNAIKGHIDNTKSKNNSTSSGYKTKNFVFVFLTDYINDPRYKNNKKDTERQLVKLINEINDYSIHISLCVFSDENRDTKGLISVEDLFKKNLLLSNYSIIDLSEDANELVQKVVLSNPIPFYYTNSLFEKGSTTTLIFDTIVQKGDTSKTRFEIKADSILQRQEFVISHRGLKKRLSNNSFTIIRNDSVYISYSGHIPSPSSSPEVIIEYSPKGIMYIAPIVFLKKFPLTGWLLLGIIGGMLLGVLCLGIKILFIKTRKLIINLIKEKLITQPSREED